MAACACGRPGSVTRWRVILPQHMHADAEDPAVLVPNLHLAQAVQLVGIAFAPAILVEPEPSACPSSISVGTQVKRNYSKTNRR
jgi:hypothetical protein